MLFTKLILAAAAFAVANAQVMLTDSSYDGITAGTPFNITWSGASGAVTLTLKNGPQGNLQTVSTIASGLTGTSYTWTPSASLPDATYAIQIDDSTGVPNYSRQFVLTGGASAAPSTAAASTTSGATTSLPGLSTSSAATTSSKLSASTTANSTSSPTTSKTKTTTSSTGTSTSAPNSSAAGLASPLALVFLALAAIVTLN